MLRYVPSHLANNPYLTAGFFSTLALVGLIGLLVLFQDRFIYFPRRYSPAELASAQSAGLLTITFRTSQGNQTAFFWRKEGSTKAPRTLWLVFGGNGEVALSWVGLLLDFADPETGFLLIDYPGYGVCEGRPNPRSILESSENALHALLEKEQWKLGSDTLCVLGHSLGGAAALQFAAGRSVRKMVILSTFTTMDDMVRSQIHFSMGCLLRHRFDNLTALKEILSRNEKAEIYLFHGEEDEVVPFKMGRALEQLDPIRIKFVPIPEGRHNDIIQMALPLGLKSALFQQG
jgi:uncharacterized protein